MSDDDNSDWDEDVLEASETMSTEASQPSTTPISTASASTSSSSSSVPNVLLASPITLSLKEVPALANGIPAGLALLYDSTKNSLSLLAYDAHKRPMFIEVFDAAKISKYAVPLSLTVTTESEACYTLVDTQSRKWKCTFSSTNDAQKMLVAVSIASIISRASVTSPLLLFVKHDLARGAGKSCKPSLFTSVRVRVWNVDVSDTRGATALAKITAATSLPTFSPDLLGVDSTQNGGGTAAAITPVVLDTVLHDIEVAEDIGVAIPTSLSTALAGGKIKTEGGARLIVVPSVSTLMTDLVATAAGTTTTIQQKDGTISVILLLPITVSKKRSGGGKKNKGEKKESSTAIAKEENVDSTQPADEQQDSTTNNNDDTTDSSTVASSSTSSSSTPSVATSTPSIFTDWSSSLSSSISSLLPSLTSMNEHIVATPNMQQKILKFVINELYEGLVQDLGLTAAKEAQEKGDEATDEPSSAAAPVDPTATAHLVALQSRVRTVLASFVEKNSGVEHRGTLASLVDRWKNDLLKQLQPLIAPTGMLSQQRVTEVTNAVVAAVAAASSSANNSSNVDPKQAKANTLALKKSSDANAKLQEELATQKRLFAELEKKHQALLLTHIDMEDSHTKLVASSGELKKRAEMCTVFESGLVELRKMLEAEIEEKQHVQASFKDLVHLQTKYKYTWLPDQKITHCMLCKKGFTSFLGSHKKGHCRFCGRVFCSSCCVQTAIPEFGYNDKVKVCLNCAEFRTATLPPPQQQGRKNEGGGDDDDDDEDLRPATSSSSKQTPRGASGKKQQQSSVLSYDSDELE